MQRNRGLEIICFDMEGTILRKVTENLISKDIPPSVWVRLAERVGPEALEEELATQEKWLRGEFKYSAWMDQLARTYRRFRLKKRLFDEVMDSVGYHPGVQETFEELKRKGYTIALLTGGFKAQADKVAEELDIDHVVAACEFFWNQDNELSHWTLLPCDAEGKLLFMKAIVEGLGFALEQSSYVGDSRSDIPCAKEARVSIAFNGHPDLQKACTYSINQPEGEEDFREILQYF
ncbi:MAG: HAD family phosphatase [Nanoarchaeota archaeon]|nr:HAD family phosphatase [Nanoarchaeota archaeon]